jgi:hypothetical protein
MRKTIRSIQFSLAILLGLSTLLPAFAYDEFDADPDVAPFSRTPRAPVKEGKVSGGYHRSIYAGPKNSRNKTAPDTTYNINTVNYDDYLKSMGKKSPNSTQAISVQSNSRESDRPSSSPDFKEQSPERPFVLTAVDNQAIPEKKTKRSILSKVTRAPRAALGVAVGVPVNIARDTTRYTKQMRTSMIDGIGVDTEQHDLVGHMFAAGTAIPFGVGTGIVQGTIKGFKQGMGKDKPTSLDAVPSRKQSASLPESERTE